MKEQVKRLIPSSILPFAQKAYWRWKFYIESVTSDFSKEQLESLTALKCVVSYNKYGGYCVPKSSRHRPAALKILANSIYEPRTIEFIRENCGDGDIVHAGTYFGDFLPALSTACKSGSKVWAFEPNPENYRCAKITLEINGLDNVVLANAGVGEKRALLRVMTKDSQGRALGGASRIIADTENNDLGSEAIQIVTVDESIGNNRNVSIVQFDVEGHEKEALTGALDTIRRCHPILVLEDLPESSLIESDWFQKNILNLGYQKSADIHGNKVFTYTHIE